MNKNRAVYLSLSALLLFLNCTGSPVRTWKERFDRTVLELRDIPVTAEGDPADFETFYTVSEKLRILSLNNMEYGMDLLKDLLLTSESIPVRAGAAITLGKIGTRDDAYPLIHALGDSSAFVDDQAYRALKRLTREDFEKNRNVWLNWWQKKEKKHDE